MAAPWIVSDELWARIEPLLPVRSASLTGPKPLPDRQVLPLPDYLLDNGLSGDELASLRDRLMS